jgi:hypothetical protein
MADVCLPDQRSFRDFQLVIVVWQASCTISGWHAQSRSRFIIIVTQQNTIVSTIINLESVAWTSGFALGKDCDARYADKVALATYSASVIFSLRAATNNGTAA